MNEGLETQIRRKLGPVVTENNMAEHASAEIYK